MPSFIRVPDRISAGDFADAPVPTSDDNGKAYAWSHADQAWVLTSFAASGVAAGSNTQVQYNNAGALAGHTGMTYDAANNALTVAGRIGIGTTPTIELDILKNQNASTAFNVRNTTSDTIARSEFGIVVNANQYLKAFMLSSGYSTSGLLAASRGLIECSGAAGLYMGASNAAGTFGIFTGGVGNANIRLLIDAGGLLTSTANNTTTNVVDDHLIIHNSTGTPAAGFGQALRFQLESSTTSSQDAGRIQMLWNVATHASRAADAVYTTFYTSVEQEFLRGRAASGGVQLGFYGVTPVARQLLALGASGDDIINALANLGLTRLS